MTEPLETRESYLRRVMPDIRMIGDDIWDATRTERGESDFILSNAIARAKKLIDDLERAYAI